VLRIVELAGARGYSSRTDKRTSGTSARELRFAALVSVSIGLATVRQLQGARMDTGASARGASSYVQRSALSHTSLETFCPHLSVPVLVFVSFLQRHGTCHLTRALFFSKGVCLCEMCGEWVEFVCFGAMAQGSGSWEGNGGLIVGLGWLWEEMMV
jgi:hypothetical protein